MSQHRRALGADGEAVAAHWYQRRGGEVVARNWRTRAGELDLVVIEGDVLVVVEVKTRSSSRHGSGAAAVDRRKQQRIRALATAFLAAWDGPRPATVRFDVAVVTPGAHGFAVEVIEHAF